MVVCAQLGCGSFQDGGGVEGVIGHEISFVKAGHPNRNGDPRYRPGRFGANRRGVDDRQPCPVL